MDLSPASPKELNSPASMWFFGSLPVCFIALLMNHSVAGSVQDARGNIYLKDMSQVQAFDRIGRMNHYTLSPSVEPLCKLTLPGHIL